MFFVFVANMLVLGYVGAVSVTPTTAIIGQVATIVYFGTFLFLPWVSKSEEAFLIKRGGLPPAVQELLNKKN